MAGFFLNTCSNADFNQMYMALADKSGNYVHPFYRKIQKVWVLEFLSGLSNTHTFIFILMLCMYPAFIGGPRIHASLVCLGKSTCITPVLRSEDTCIISVFGEKHMHHPSFEIRRYMHHQCVWGKVHAFIPIPQFAFNEIVRGSFFLWAFP